MTDCSNDEDRSSLVHHASEPALQNAPSQTNQRKEDEIPPGHRQVSPTSDMRLYASSCAPIASPVTLEEARLAATHMKQLSSHYHNATLGSPISAPALTKFTAIAPAPENPIPIERPHFTPAASAYGKELPSTPDARIFPAQVPATTYQASTTAAYHPANGYYASQSSQMQEVRYHDNTLMSPDRAFVTQSAEAAKNYADTGLISKPIIRPPRKHRRTGSYGTSLRHHKRTFSGRAFTVLKRQTHHTREDSAGLDILSAAVEGVSQDELAAVAGSGQKQHRRDESVISAFGSLGSLDFKRLLNNISPAPPDVQAINNDKQSLPLISGEQGGNTVPEVVIDPRAASMPVQVQVPIVKRAPTPPTPMISNIQKGSMHGPPTGCLDVPVFAPQVSACAGNNQVSHVRYSSPSNMTAGSTHPALQRPSLRVSVNSGGPPLKKHHQRHMSSFSAYTSNPSTNSNKGHSRDPSETSKMLMQLERKIDQEVAHYTRYEAPPPAHVSQPKIYHHVSVKQEPLELHHQQHEAPYPRHTARHTRSPATIFHTAPMPPAQITQPAIVSQAPICMPINAAPSQLHAYTPAGRERVPTPSGRSSAEVMPPPPLQSITHLPTQGVRRPVVQIASSLPQSVQPNYVHTEDADADDDNQGKSNSSSGKRVRRKCSVQDCPNRVVQGGRCISHGAKRKQCAHPGCNKNVKKAGLCSTHGPARKRCEHAGCEKVAVQGGRCITHGARKKLCSFDGCQKQGIINGHCKKHYDETSGKGTNMNNYKISRTHSPSAPNTNPSPIKVNKAVRLPSESSSQPGLAKPVHKRGLSVFFDMNAVNALTSTDQSGTNYEGDEPPAAQQAETASTKKRKAHARGLSIFSDENVSNAIISGALNDSTVNQPMC